MPESDSDDPGADLAPSARRPRLRIGVGAAVVLFLGSLAGAALLSAWSGGGGTVEAPADGPAPATESSVVLEEPVLLVHVAGAVRRPGLVQLAQGARVVDAIAAAGGLAEDAAADAVNLARPVADGEQLVVPVVGEAADAAPPGVSGDGRVRLSTADQATLETLPGIGPALAQRIIDWRAANGGFSDVEQLREVAGIGEVTLGRLRELVVP